MRTSLLVSAVLFSSCLYRLQAQAGAGLPAQFIQFFRTYALVNPASMGKDSSIEVSTGNRSLTGAFSGVRTFYLQGNVRLNAASRLSRQVLGISFINDREGSFINRNRVALQYAFHLPLNRKTLLSAGVAAGFINYAYKASNISAGGSAFAPNAELGLWLHRRRFNAGLSANQVIPSTLTPIDETSVIERYYTASMDGTFWLNPYLSLTPMAMLRWQNEDFYNLDVALMALIQQKVSMTAGYKYEKGASVSGGLDAITLGRQQLHVMFSYYFPLGGFTSYNPQSYELSLRLIPSADRRSGWSEEEDEE